MNLEELIAIFISDYNVDQVRCLLFNVFPNISKHTLAYIFQLAIKLFSCINNIGRYKNNFEPSV